MKQISFMGNNGGHSAANAVSFVHGDMPDSNTRHISDGIELSRRIEPHHNTGFARSWAQTLLLVVLFHTIAVSHGDIRAGTAGNASRLDFSPLVTEHLSAMDELVWLNGQTVPLSDAKVAIDDRGFQFADGVYEVIRIYDGRMFAATEHLDRLERSCDGISLTMPIAKSDLFQAMQRLIDQSKVSEGTVYVQLTRGVARRAHLCPPDTRPTLLFFVRPQPPIPRPGVGPGATLWTVQDERWRKCWIKSTALLANVLAKLEAAKHGADEAAFVEDGIFSECASSNLFVVSKGQLITHPPGRNVLPGITRGVVVGAAADIGVPVIERGPTMAEARAAEEVFITGTTREIHWVSSWDACPVGNGECGPLTIKLHHAFIKRRQQQLARLDQPLLSH
jgi:D-alanine transaminase